MEKMAVERGCFEGKSMRRARAQGDDSLPLAESVSCRTCNVLLSLLMIFPAHDGSVMDLEVVGGPPPLASLLCFTVFPIFDFHMLYPLPDLTLLYSFLWFIISTSTQLP